MSFLKNLFGKVSPADKDKIERSSVFETHKNQIYPWVKVVFEDKENTEDPSSLILESEDLPIYRDWLGDLAIFYVADMGNRFQMILKRDLPKDLSREQLHQMAVENLRKNIEYKLRESSFGAHGLIAGGDHEAASICLPEFWGRLSESFKDNLIVAIPSKDLVIIVPENKMEVITSMKTFVHDFFKNGERLLTRNIFKFDKSTKQWTIFGNVS